MSTVHVWTVYWLRSSFQDGPNRCVYFWLVNLRFVILTSVEPSGSQQGWFRGALGGVRVTHHSAHGVHLFLLKRSVGPAPRASRLWYLCAEHTESENRFASFHNTVLRFVLSKHWSSLKCCLAAPLSLCRSIVSFLHPLFTPHIHTARMHAACWRKWTEVRSFAHLKKDSVLRLDEELNIDHTPNSTTCNVALRAVILKLNYMV